MKKIRIKFNKNETKFVNMLIHYAKKELGRERRQYQLEFSKYYSYDLEGNELKLTDQNEDYVNKLRETLRQNHYMNKFIDDVVEDREISDVEEFEKMFLQESI